MRELRDIASPDPRWDWQTIVEWARQRRHKARNDGFMAASFFVTLFFGIFGPLFAGPLYERMLLSFFFFAALGGPLGVIAYSAALDFVTKLIARRSKAIIESPESFPPK